MEPDIKDQILSVISKNGTEGSTSSEIEKAVKYERHTLSKYLSLMEKEGILNYKQVGKGRLWFVNRSPLQKISKTRNSSLTYTEKLMSEVMSHIPLGLSVIDRDYNIVYINNVVRENYGEITGKKFYASVLGLKSPAALKKLNLLMDGDAEVCSIKISDGKDRILQVRGSKLVNPDSSMSIIIITEDITEKELSDERLKFSEHLYRSVGELIPYGIWIASSQGEFIYVSESMLKLLGITIEEYKAKGWLAGLNESEKERISISWKECLETQKDWNEILFLTGSDGKEHTLLSKGMAIRDKKGNIMYWAGRNLDITDMERSKKDLKLAYEKLKEVDSIKSSILRDVARDLKQPVSLITMSIDTLSEIMNKNSPDREKAMKYLDILQRNSRMFEEQLSSVLQLSKVASKESMEEGEVDVGKIIEKAVTHYRASAEEKGLVVKADVKGECIVNGSEDLLLTMVKNLVGNAVKFTKKGTVEASCYRENGNVVILVEDTGIGIRKRDMERIFDPFVKLDISIEGIGIGLSVCREIAELHNGQIKVISEPEKGTIFKTIIPKRRD